MTAILIPEEVREFVQDYPEANLILDKEEFSNTYISLCISLAVSEFNSISPRTGYSDQNFPSKSLLLQGTLWQMYSGRATLMARNHLSYSDGNLVVPVEEKWDIYSNLAASFGTQFKQGAQALKINQNLESGWGSISSDEAHFPLY